MFLLLLSYHTAEKMQAEDPRYPNRFLAERIFRSNLCKFQFIALLDFEICRTSGATAAAGRNGFPRGEAVKNRHFGTDF